MIRTRDESRSTRVDLASSRNLLTNNRPRFEVNWFIARNYFIQCNNQHGLLNASSATAVNCTAFNAAVVANQRSAQLWRFIPVSNGVYLIRNERHNNYLTAATGTGTAITLSARLTGTARNRQEWRIVRQNNGISTIESTSRPGWFMIKSTATGTGVTLSNANVGTQRNWRLRPLTMRVDVLFDQAFVAKHGGTVASARNFLNQVFHGRASGGRSISEAIMQDFGVHVNFVIRSNTFASFPYVHQCARVGNRTLLCSNSRTAMPWACGTRSSNNAVRVTECQFIQPPATLRLS